MVYRRGEYYDGDPRIAVAQLSHPTSVATVIIAGLIVDNLPDAILTAPQALSGFVEAERLENHQLLLTPKFSHKDLHVGKQKPWILDHCVSLTGTRHG